MKYALFCLVVLVTCYTPGFCQTKEYTMAMYNKLVEVKSIVAEKYKDSFLIRRIETGTLETRSGQLFGSTQRQLFSGNEYIVVAFTDARVSNLKIKAYKEDGDNWTTVSTRDEYSDDSRSDLIGDLEVMAITPREDAVYKFEISNVSSVSGSTSSRYGILVFSKESSSNSGSGSGSGSSGTGTSTSNSSRVYRIDNYAVSKWDTQKGEYGDWSDPTTYSCSFTINSEETVVTWKRPNSEDKTYYIVETDRSLAKWTNYTIQSSDGERYMFMTPKLNGEYIRVSKLEGDKHNNLTDYHIQSQPSVGTRKSKTTYSIDNYAVSEWDTKNSKYSDFGSETKFSCLFEIDAEETKITWREASGPVSNFTILSKDDSDDRWIIYTIKSSGGNRYRFMVPNNDTKYIRVVKITDTNTRNSLTDYHIASKW